MTELRVVVEAALDEGRWADALDALTAAGDAARTPELLELRARAAYGAGDLEASIGAWEDLHGLLCTADPVAAARAAAMVAMFLMIDTGLMSPVRGWLRRADRLVEGHDDASARALTAACRAYERFMCGDLEEARRHSDLAVELGRRLDVPPAVVIGRTAGARIAILEGRVDEGIGELEEVGALLMSGEVDALTTGMMLCELVCAAQGLARHDMAAEWTDAMERWGHGAAFGGLHGRCRVHRAEILRVTGPCDAAEEEALGACDDLRPWMRREFGWPLAELGTIRLRRGDLDGAEEAYLAAQQHVWCPHPGLALVRLARGDVDGAVALIDDAVEHPFLAPSKERPPSSDLTLAPLLESQVEIAAAADDVGAARRATERLRVIADTYRSPWLRAAADLAEARTALLAGDPAAASVAAGAAVAAWADLGAPYEMAAARLVLADARDRAGNPTAARMERDAALRAFEAFGAEHRAAQLRHVLGGDGTSTDTEHDDAHPGATATFRLDGDVRTVTFEGRTTALADLKGFRYLARLLADPGREVHVLDLVAVEQGTLPTGRTEVVGAAEVDGLAGGGLPALDEQARDAYRRRLADIEDDIADAERCNDPARIELAERDREFLIAELSRSVGLGGRLRSVGSDAERARTAVTRTLRYAIARLAEHDPALGAHLESSVQTGTYCAYRPDPRAQVAWEV